MYMCIYIYIYIYIYNQLPPVVIIDLPPFINYLKITLKSSTQTKIKSLYCTKFVIAPVKGFSNHWILKLNVFRDIPTCRALFLFSLFFTGKRQRKSTKNLSKICHWKLVFVIWSYSTWARGHARHLSMWGRKAH